MNVYVECAHKQHVRRTLTLTLTHTITAYSASGMSYVSAYSSVQLDESGVEKEFTKNSESLGRVLDSDLVDSTTSLLNLSLL